MLLLSSATRILATYILREIYLPSQAPVAGVLLDSHVFEHPPPWSSTHQRFPCVPSEYAASPAPMASSCDAAWQKKGVAQKGHACSPDCQGHCYGSTTALICARLSSFCWSILLYCRLDFLNRSAPHRSYPHPSWMHPSCSLFQKRLCRSHRFRWPLRHLQC